MSTGQGGNARRPHHVGGDPSVSVIIPAYNCAATILTAVESALEQSLTPVEVIVIDDGSTDDILGALRPVCDKVTLVRQPNGGLAAARARGHTLARGEFIAWLDADDICVPGRLAAQVEVLQQLPEVILVSTGFSAFDRDGEIAPSFAADYYHAIGMEGLAGLYPALHQLTMVAENPVEPAMPVHFGPVYPRIAWGNFVHPPTTMHRRAAIERIGPPDPKFTGAEDWEYFVRLSRLGSFAHIDHPFLRYRLSPGQMSAPANSAKNIAAQMLVLERTVGDDPTLRSDRNRLRQLNREWHIELARSRASVDRPRALGHLVRSIAYGVRFGALLRAAAHVLAPGGLLNVMRRVRAAVAGSVPVVAQATGGSTDTSVVVLLSGLEQYFSEVLDLARFAIGG